MFRPGEDAAYKLVHWLNIKEAWYLKQFGKNINHGGSADSKVMVLGEKGWELFTTWQQAGQAQWQAVQNAQRVIAEVLDALQSNTVDDARRLMERNFKQVPMTWDVLKDRAGHLIVTPVVESQTPLGYAICLLGTVSQSRLVRRIRECKHCKERFFAKPAKKIYCSVECQEHFWADYRRGDGREEYIGQLKRWREAKKTKRGEKPK